jgi:hypothetical protein
MCQLKNFKCQEYFKNGPLIETRFTLFIDLVGISTYQHFWFCEYLSNIHLVEKCFQLYPNIVDELI